MNTARSLTFLFTSWSLAASVVIVLLTTLLSFFAWRRTGYRRDYGCLELLRLSIVVLTVLLFNQPEWVEEFRPKEKPSVVVLTDASRSMDTQDVSENGSTARITRRQSIAPLNERKFWTSLEDKHQVVIQAFAQGADVKGSDLYAPLAQAAQQTQNLRAVVLASDGDWNEGKPPVDAAAALRLKGVPVFVVPSGSPVRLPDLELLSFDAPTFGLVGKSVRIPFTIESTLPREVTLPVTLKTSDGDEVTKEVRIAAMGRTTDWLSWKSKDVKDYTLTLEFPKQADELLTENNKLSSPISIRQEKLRVLIVESIPRWEYRYLRNALSRDPGVNLSCLLYHPGLSKSGSGNKDYIKQFPGGLDELGKYDVVFLGDVGVESGQLTAEDCRLLKGLVEHQASGLVFMPGWQGKQMSLLETELADLYPVMLDPSQPGGWGSRSACQFELTESGRRSLLTRLADTQEDNLDVWENLPGFQWYAAVTRAKVGSEILAVHREMSNQHGRLPLLASRTFGAGKVLFMGTDGAWRWRKGVEDKYHYRFWGQVVRWMAYQRNMAKGESMRLYYSPEQPQIRQTVVLKANVMEKTGEPLAVGDVVARIVAPSGKQQTVRFQSTGDEWGEFTSPFTPVESGRHDLTLSCQQTSGSLNAAIFVQGVEVERLGRAARPEVLAEIARMTQGKVIEPGQLKQVLQSLAELPEPAPEIRRLQLWSHPVTIGLMITLLALFWVGRKVVGLI
ncbi:MAG: hypothetical protein JWN70_4820 [Planctomycetaceae bacterium]|nr:hypothetical protein [Planctomycetaceae bacterium]